MLSILLACNIEPERFDGDAPATLPAFVEPAKEEEPEPRVERFTLETLSRLIPAGQTPPPCHYLARFNEAGVYNLNTDQGNGVSYDALTVPILDTVFVHRDGQDYQVVKVLVPDYDYGRDEWVHVLWFDRDAFTDSPEKAAAPDLSMEPDIPGSCAVPAPKPTVQP